MSLPRSRWTEGLRVDRYVVDVLLRDLVGHDRQPAAFLAWIWLSAQADAKGRLEIGLRGIAEGTGLSKSAVQLAVALLERRGLLARKARPAPHPTRYEVRRPWALLAASFPSKRRPSSKRPSSGKPQINAD